MPILYMNCGSFPFPYHRRRLISLEIDAGWGESQFNETLMVSLSSPRQDPYSLIIDLDEASGRKRSRFETFSRNAWEGVNTRVFSPRHSHYLCLNDFLFNDINLLKVSASILLKKKVLCVWRYVHVRVTIVCLDVCFYKMYCWSTYLELYFQWNCLVR